MGLSYFFAKEVNLGYAEAVSTVTERLKEVGFGILTEIDVKATLKQKLDVDFPRYLILGACNPPFAHRSLQVEDRIGLMLPCNVIVRETSSGQVEVAAIDPLASMQAVANAELASIGGQVREKLEQVIQGLP
jgi:uncharacterized protein (DUF302 family)